LACCVGGTRLDEDMVAFLLSAICLAPYLLAGVP
jgi:hypothetical protein